MARKAMKRRFADGGSVGKYDARIKSKRDDIESDYKKALAKGGMVKKARGGGIAQRGHGKGRMC